MKALFLIGAVAKRPRPVQERPIRKALLRVISGMYDDSRPCNHIGAGARLISQPSLLVSMSCRAALVIVSRRAPSSNLPTRLPSWPLLGVFGRSRSAHVLEGEWLRGRWGRRRFWRQTRHWRNIWLLCLRCLLHAL